MNNPNQDIIVGNQSEKSQSVSAPRIDELFSELAKFGYEERGFVKLIDTSHGDDDIRLNFIISNKWVLRFCKAPEMTEERLADLNRLIDRYIEFGLKCPRFLADAEGKYIHEWNGLACYLQEYIDLPIADELNLDEEEQDKIWHEVLDSVAAFAEKYRDVDISDTMGMYSLFDLSPFDVEIGIDEKQQNFDSLCKELKDLGEHELVERLETKHGQVRENLKKIYRDLPQCVFQDDENFSNVLLDNERHLAGLIDFNLSGTEVIVNHYANLCGGFKDDVEEPMGAETRLKYAIDSYRKYQGRMLSIYNANDLEKQAMPWYTWIALVAGWPQVCFFLDGLKKPALKDEILELLSLMANYSLDRLE